MRVHEHISAMVAWVPNIAAPLNEYICYVFQCPKTACKCVPMEVRKVPMEVRKDRVPSDPQMSFVHVQKKSVLTTPRNP